MTKKYAMPLENTHPLSPYLPPLWRQNITFSVRSMKFMRLLAHTAHTAQMAAACPLKCAETWKLMHLGGARWKVRYAIKIIPG